MLAYCLILILLLCPDDTPVPHQVPAPLWNALKQVASDLELTGPRCPWITDFRSEVNWVRQHWREAANYPPLADSARLPPCCLIRQNLCFNRAYQHYLEARWLLRAHEREQLDDALKETQQLGRVWEAMAAASADELNWFCRRQALAQLRELLGDEAYYRGDWPPPAPVAGGYCLRHD